MFQTAQFYDSGQVVFNMGQRAHILPLKARSRVS